MKTLHHVPLGVSTAAVLALLSFPQWSALVVAVRAATTAAKPSATSEKGPTSEATPGETSPLPVLKGSLKPLIEQFNEDKDKPRVLALLSPA